MRFDWKDLEVFVLACDSGSLTRAAEQACLTLPAVSARIHRLEEASGAALLTRHSRGVAPTPTGELVLRRARAAAAEIRHLRTELDDAEADAQPAVKVLCNTSALVQHMPRAIAGVLIERPRAVLDVAESPSRRTVRELREQRADIGVVSDAVDTQGLDVEVLCEDHLAVLVPAAHPLASEAEVSFADALAFPLLGLGPDTALGLHLAEQAQRLGRAWRPRVSINSFGAIRTLVQRNLGVAVVPEGVSRGAAGDDAIRAVPLRERWARRTLLACAARRVTDDEKAHRIYQGLVRALRSR